MFNRKKQKTMETFDLFNNREFNRTRINLSFPKLNLQIPYLINLKYGTLTGILMSITLFLIKEISYNQIMLLPLVTFPLLAFGVTMSIRDYGFKSGQAKIGYFDGLLNGYITGTVSVVSFAAFLLWYLSERNAVTMFYSPLTSACAMLMSGMAMVAICSLMAMQYFKNYQFKK